MKIVCIVVLCVFFGVRWIASMAQWFKSDRQNYYFNMWMAILNAINLFAFGYLLKVM